MAIGGKKIRVLVVDDSILARKLIIDGLNKYPNIEVVGYAINAVDAKGKVTGVGAGTCTVYAVAENGLRVGVKITVK